MIRIINSGKTDEKFKVTCRCGCEFEYDKTDLRPLHSSNAVDCPECSRPIIHELFRRETPVRFY